jgi:LmbE family N-acetylglucosaminyl deacetylase
MRDRIEDGKGVEGVEGAKGVELLRDWERSNRMSDAAVDRTEHPASRDQMRLLGLYAHPDDETFCTGGTFARYAEQGAEVMVVTATRGEAGQIRDAGIATRRTIGQVRERELRLACTRLGVQEVRCLRHRDGALARADLEILVGELTQLIRDFRPTAVFTLGPDGGYGHPDHVTISSAATEAWHRASDPTQFPEQLGEDRTTHTPDALYYAHFPRHPRRLLDRMVRWLVGQEERFRGDVGFVKALLHIAEGARDLHSISDHIETAWFPAGTFVIEQGEAATTLYLILSGEAEAVREFDDGSIDILGRLEPGQFFGEMGIAAGKPRNAHVIAHTDLTCLQFSPAEPAPYLGRGAGAHLTGSVPELTLGQEELGEATTRIDVGAVIHRKISAIAAYRSQFAFQPELIPTSLLLDLFGVEYFVRARPPRALETDIL